MAKHVEDQISSYIDGQMKHGEKAAFEKHIHECDECKKMLKETQKAVLEARGLKEKPLPHGYFDRLSVKLDKAGEKKPKWNFNFVSYMQGFATAAALILVVVMTRYTLKETNNFQNIRAGKNAESNYATVTNLPATQVQGGLAGLKNKDETKFAGLSFAPAEQIAAAPEAGNSGQLEDKEQALTYNTVKTFGQAEKKEEEQAPVIMEKPAIESKTYSTAAPAAMVSAKKAKQLKVTIGEQNGEWTGTYSQQKEASYMVFKNLVAWQKFSESDSDIYSEHPDIDMTDFSSNMLVAVFIGEKPTAGYSVEITEIDKGTDKIIVKYKINAPAKDSITAQVLTHPYCIKATATSTLPVEFQEIQ